MSHSSRSRFHTSLPLFAGAALFALSLQAKDDATMGLLNRELPHGTILENASCAETVFATRQAVRKHPDQAVPIMKSAIDSRVSPGERPARSGAARTPRDAKDGVVPCECVTRIVQAALQSAPNNKAHQIIEEAMAMQPQCGEEIAGLLKKPGIDFKDGPAAADNGSGSGNRDGNGSHNGDLAANGNNQAGGYGSGFGGNLLGGGESLGNGGFGSGTGGGFPGSPGFLGSAPGGANSNFPAVNNPPLTSVVNP